MATVQSFFNSLLSLVLLLFHLGCFIFNINDHPPAKKRKVSFFSPSSPSQSHSKFDKAFSFTRSYIKKIFSFKKQNKNDETQLKTEPATLASARSSQHSIVSVLSTDSILLTPLRKRSPIMPCHETSISIDNPSFPPLQNDIFPCTTCGEIFHNTKHLEQHQSTKHAISELYDGDSGKNVVQIIFKTGWNDKEKKKNPIVHRILKIHNSPKILSRFEEYREYVKLKAARNSVRWRDERCIADGNELLRFHCTTFVCNLGKNGNSSVCNLQHCSICGIIRSGFSAKMDGISTLSSSWRAHVALPDELEEEFAFMNLKRAMLICRVISGRIGCDREFVDKDESGFDSVVGRGGGAGGILVEDELLVFNPRAVLPCFVIVYSVQV